MMHDCKYCNNLNKSYHKTRKTQKGGWNPQKEAGMIIAHGKIINDSFVVVPEGIELRPLAHIGTNYNLAHLFQYMDNLNNPIDRFKEFDNEESNEYSGRIYKSGDVIPDMILHFKMIWRNSEDTPHIREDSVGYFYSGILTNAVISYEYMKLMVGDLNELNTLIKKDSMSHNDNSIGIKWDDTLTLGNVLKKMVDAQVMGKFWLLACRPGDIIKAERACGKEKIRNTLKQSMNVDFFNEYTMKLQSINDFGVNIKTNNTILKNNHHVIEIFIKNLYRYVLFKLSKDNNFTIDTDLLCDINEIYDKGIITTSFINKTRDKLVFFKQFWKEYNIVYNKKGDQMKDDAKDRRDTKKHKQEEFAFKFE